MNWDPRESMIEKRLKGVKKLAVVSAKGGVGKSTISAILALILRERARVGLLDLDAYNPSIPAILGIKELKIGEDRGIIPQYFEGLYVLSFAHFTKERATPLRGKELSDALKEILTATIWNVDLLIIDTPPGMGEATLELLRFFRDAKFLVVTTPSLLAEKALEKEIELLGKEKIIGIIENMSERGVRFSDIDKAYRDTEMLLRSDVARDLKRITDELWKKL